MRRLLFYPLLLLSSALWGIGQYPAFCFIRFFGLLPFIYIIYKRENYLLESLVFGFIAYLLNFYWLYITISESEQLPMIFALIIPAALCLWYALQYPLIAALTRFIKKSWAKLSYLSFPFIFVTIDYLFPKIFKHSIGDSQIGFYPFIQLIDLTGMTGVILIFLFFNLGLYRIISRFSRKRPIRAVHLLFVLPLGLALLYGGARIYLLDRELESLPAVDGVMVQGNISGKQKLDRKFFRINTDTYNRLSIESLEEGEPDLIIWPESVFNRAYDLESSSLANFLYRNYPPLILGVVTIKGQELANSALLIKDGAIADRYDKQHLLIFAEYTPFEELFPFLKKLTPLPFSLKAGEGSSIIKFQNRRGDSEIRASLSICFEDIFADEIRRKTAPGSNLMINITNDSWFGLGLGPLHHSILARLRGIENRRSLFRCTATGLTTATDPLGRVKSKGTMGRSESIRAALPLYEKRTLYSHIGELFTYLSILISAAAIALSCLKKGLRKL